MSRVTAADKARAERIMVAIHDAARGGLDDLAKLLAEMREEAIACAVVRVERTFAVRERKARTKALPHARTDAESQEKST